MDDVDRDTFARAFRRLATLPLRDRPGSRELATVEASYFKILRRFPIEAVITAARTLAETRTRFPAPAEWAGAITAAESAQQASDRVALNHDAVAALEDARNAPASANWAGLEKLREAIATVAKRASEPDPRVVAAQLATERHVDGLENARRQAALQFFAQLDAAPPLDTDERQRSKVADIRQGKDRGRSHDRGVA